MYSTFDARKSQDSDEEDPSHKNVKVFTSIINELQRSHTEAIAQDVMEQRRQHTLRRQDTPDIRLVNKAIPVVKGLRTSNTQNAELSK